MRNRAWTRTALGAAALALGACAAGCASGGSAAPSAPSLEAAPSPTAVSAPPTVARLAAVGDSITLGVNACDEGGPCLDESWAVGTSDVDAFAARLADESGARPTTLPFALDGATAKDALDHVQEVIDQRPDVVTVLVGANDACARTFDAMTPADRFASEITALLQELTRGLPEATVLALSVPDLNQIWEIGKDDPDAVALWDKSPSCRSLLWHADSTAADDATRRAAVAERVQQFNAAIAGACAALPTCVSDGGALHDVRFSADEVSSIDHFHPSALGQAKIADVAWQVWQSRPVGEGAG
ncbi:SGNH/GDSL hydrolase family protein [Xylanimonas ulmi]|uniref:Lysophospholipase L1-like esterase n=1 Tax=Xylanimonas ulmi TaxID=228973 RepID=A0A4Q7M5B4_9MICO|nr:GDSL-type esterase/lipase family protein [Xylanibacterium ulmi]RZS62611.1 lysophospholipase L1-like esterase [Xylanibacterium ulmi]